MFGEKVSKAKDLYAFKKQADKLKKRMEKIVVDVDVRGVEIKMQGDQVVQSVVVDGVEDDRLRKAFNKALKVSQKKVAKKMRGAFGDMGIPGM